MSRRSDIYTGLLFISMLALVTSSLLLLLDYRAYGLTRPPAPVVSSRLAQ